MLHGAATGWVMLDGAAPGMLPRACAHGPPCVALLIWSGTSAVPIPRIFCCCGRVWSLIRRRGPRAPEEKRVMGGVVKRRGGAADIGERGMQERVGGMWRYVGLLPADLAPAVAARIM